MTLAPFSVCTARRIVTKAPGQSRSSLLANSALTRTVPEAASTALSTNCSLPVSAVPPSGSTAVTLPPPARIVASASPRLRCGRLKATAIGSSWVIVTSAVAARLHGAAGEDVDRAGAAGGRRDDAVVRQADLRRVDRGAVGGDDGALRLDQRLVGVDGALRDEVLREQVAAARQLALGVGERGLVLGELRPRLGDVDLVVARVEREQRLAGVDELAFLDVHLGDDARDLRPDVDAVERGDRAGRVEHHVDVALLHGDRA